MAMLKLFTQIPNLASTLGSTGRAWPAGGCSAVLPSCCLNRWGLWGRAGV